VPPISDLACDVLIVGSGSAALSAALRAAHGGLDVLVAEKTERLGGTTAMSGAGIWIPANHVASAFGIEDSPAEALAYIRSAAPDGWKDKEDELWQRFVQEAPLALAFIEEQTPLEFRLVPQADPLAGKPGAKSLGRMVTPKALRRRVMGRFADRLRGSTLPHIYTYDELIRHDLVHFPVSGGLRLLPRLLWRFLTGQRAQGSALVTGLVAGCLKAGCRFELSARACELIVDPDDGLVTGALLDRYGKTITVEARRGVVLATGGFEWDRELLARYFPGPVYRLGSPRSNEGDGQKMAAAIGAQLDHMDQANILPCLPTVYEGQPHCLPLTFQADAHAILVDKSGRRFVSETEFNIGEVLDQRDPASGQPRHLPAWVVADQRFLNNSLVFRWYARRDPNWVVRGGSIADLARRIGLPQQALEATIDRFNGQVRNGEDTDFGRRLVPRSRLGLSGRQWIPQTLEKPPFIAMSLDRSFLGTKGGARTNSNGQVLRADGSVIPGLYAAGLAMANPIGTRAVGIGTTIGPNLTWGYICAETLLKDNRR
jgi:3-oxosteroid 1-dehydrogenase